MMSNYIIENYREFVVESQVKNIKPVKRIVTKFNRELNRLVFQIVERCMSKFGCEEKLAHLKQDIISEARLGALVALEKYRFRVGEKEFRQAIDYDNFVDNLKNIKPKLRVTVERYMTLYIRNYTMNYIRKELNYYKYTSARREKLGKKERNIPETKEAKIVAETKEKKSVVEKVKNVVNVIREFSIKSYKKLKEYFSTKELKEVKIFFKRFYNTC